MKVTKGAFMKKKTIIISSVVLVFITIISVVAFVINKDEIPETNIYSTLETHKLTSTSTTTPSETESTTNETTTLVTTTTKKASVTKSESTTKKSSTTKESTTKKTSNNTNNNIYVDENGNQHIIINRDDGKDWTGIPTEPDFEYINKVTTYDGRTFYKVYDAERDYYYYTDVTGSLKYHEDGVLEDVRPSKTEIKSNPISKVTLNGVTWYKYKTARGTNRYLASDGRDSPGIEIGIPTNGKDSITISGITFYKTYNSKSGEYEYVDANGNYLLYDGSYCMFCGESGCAPAMNTYYCVICKEDIPAHKCHPDSHYDESH